MNDPEVRDADFPAGGLMTTAGDIALFYQALLNDGRAHDGTRIWQSAINQTGAEKDRHVGSKDEHSSSPIFAPRRSHGISHAWQAGLRVSDIGFGAMTIGGEIFGATDDNESLRALNRALDLGMNFIDTADAIFGATSSGCLSTKGLGAV